MFNLSSFMAKTDGTPIYNFNNVNKTFITPTVTILTNTFIYKYFKCTSHYLEVKILSVK